MNLHDQLETIIELVASESDCTPEQLLAKDRTHPTVWVRQVAMWVCRHTPIEVYGQVYAAIPLQNIARSFKKCDHGTVLHAIRTVESRRYTCRKIRVATDELLVRVHAELDRLKRHNLVQFPNETNARAI